MPHVRFVPSPSRRATADAPPPETKHDPVGSWLFNALGRIADGTGLTSGQVLDAAKKRAGHGRPIIHTLIKWADEVGRPISPPGVSR